MSQQAFDTYQISIDNALRMEVSDRHTNISGNHEAFHPQPVQYVLFCATVAEAWYPNAHIFRNFLSPEIHLPLQGDDQLFQNDKKARFVGIRIGVGSHGDDIWMAERFKKFRFNGEIDHPFGVFFFGQVGAQHFEHKLA